MSRLAPIVHFLWLKREGERFVQFVPEHGKKLKWWQMWKCVKFKGRVKVGDAGNAGDAGDAGGGDGV